MQFKYFLNTYMESALNQSDLDTQQNYTNDAVPPRITGI